MVPDINDGKTYTVRNNNTLRHGIMPPVWRLDLAFNALQVFNENWDPLEVVGTHFVLSLFTMILSDLAVTLVTSLKKRVMIAAIHSPRGVTTATHVFALKSSRGTSYLSLKDKHNRASFVARLVAQLLARALSSRKPRWLLSAQHSQLLACSKYQVVLAPNVTN